MQSGVSGGHDGTWAALEDELNDGMRSNPGRGAVTEIFGDNTLGEPICYHFSVVLSMFRGCGACLFDYSMHPRYALIPARPTGRQGGQWERSESMVGVPTPPRVGSDQGLNQVIKL